MPGESGHYENLDRGNRNGNLARGGFAMAVMQPATWLDPRFDRQNALRPAGYADTDAPEVWLELDALLEKSEKLTELVARLSLVMKGVVERP